MKFTTVGTLAFSLATISAIPSQATDPFGWDPPSRPWATSIDGLTYLVCEHQNECATANISIDGHRIWFRIVARMNKFQTNEGYTTIIQSQFPYNRSFTAVDISFGGVDVRKYYTYDDAGYWGWDGTSWSIGCGADGNSLWDVNQVPAPPSAYPPCMGSLVVNLSPDGQSQFSLISPYLIQYDGKWHVYDVFVNTAVGGYGIWKAVTALDNAVLTNPWDCQTSDYQQHTMTDCNRTYYGRSGAGAFNIPLDGMDWSIFADRSFGDENIWYTIPTLRTSHTMMAAVFASWFYADGAFATDYLNWWPNFAAGIWRPTDPATSPTKTFGYTQSINLWGDRYSFARGTGADPWEVRTTSFNDGFLFWNGMGLQPAATDPY